MSEKQTEFTFNNFQVLKSEIYFNSGEMLRDATIDITPKGKFFENKKAYSLQLDLAVRTKDGSVVINLIAMANFTFQKEFDEIPNYFTLNAPAIAYPFLRSYVTALSSLSGMDTIYLPIMNLTSLSEQLKNTFERISE